MVAKLNSSVEQSLVEAAVPGAGVSRRYGKSETGVLMLRLTRWTLFWLLIGDILNPAPLS